MAIGTTATSTIMKSAHQKRVPKKRDIYHPARAAGKVLGVGLASRTDPFARARQAAAAIELRPAFTPAPAGKGSQSQHRLRRPPRVSQ
jgi:hypothetical protein